MSAEFFEKCMATIKNNEPEADEISASGLTPRPASWVDAPMADECFMNLECRYQWEKEIVPGDDHAMICLEVIGMHIDETHLAGRTGDQSVLFNIHHPQNPEITEKTGHDYAGVIQKKSIWENIDCGPYSNPKGGGFFSPQFRSLNDRSSPSWGDCYISFPNRRKLFACV